MDKEEMWGETTNTKDHLKKTHENLILKKLPKIHTYIHIYMKGIQIESLNTIREPHVDILSHQVKSLMAVESLAKGTSLENPKHHRLCQALLSTN